MKVKINLTLLVDLDEDLVPLIRCNECNSPRQLWEHLHARLKKADILEAPTQVYHLRTPTMEHNAYVDIGYKPVSEEFCTSGVNG